MDRMFNVMLIHNMSRETGAGPRGDRSRFIETDSGLVQSKYR